MKKIICVVLLCVLAFSFCSCADNNEKKQDETVLHTIAPSSAVAVEWCPIDCEIALVDENGEAVIEKEDFDTFALIGSTDADCELKIKLRESAKDMLSFIISDETAVTKLILNIDGADIIEVNDVEGLSKGEFTIKPSTYEEGCKLATKIRGL